MLSREKKFCLFRYPGEKPLFMGSGTITESEEFNGTYFGTILTSASLLRTSAESDAIPDNIKVVILSFSSFLYLTLVQYFSMS